MSTKAKTVKLIHGVRLGKKGEVLPLIEHLEPYTLTLLQPIDGIEEIQFRPATIGDIIAVGEAASRDHDPGSRGYGKAVLRANLDRRCSPSLSDKQLDQLAVADHVALQTLIDSGRDPLNPDNDAYKLKEGVEVERTAYMRLPMQSDRKLAEQRMPTTPEDDPVLYAAYLTWFVTRFGEPSETMFDGKTDFQAFLNLSWGDFQVLHRELLKRDYKPLTDILDGKVEVDGKPLPFQGVSEPDTETPKTKGKRRAATAA